MDKRMLHEKETLKSKMIGKTDHQDMSCLEISTYEAT